MALLIQALSGSEIVGSVSRLLFVLGQIWVIILSIRFTVGSLMAWVGPSFIWVLLGRVLEAAGTGVMWPVLQITVPVCGRALGCADLPVQALADSEGLAR